MQTQAKPSGCAPAVVPSSLFSECINAFYFMISSSSPALNTGVHREVRADFALRAQVRGTNPPQLLIAILLIVCFRKQAAQGRYFLFANPFKVEQICKTEHRWQQNSGLDANHPLRLVVLFHLWLVALNLLVFYIVCFGDTLQLYKNIKKWKSQWREWKLFKCRVKWIKTNSLSVHTYI